MFVIPQEVGKGEKWQIVVCPLEASEACYDNYNKEHLFDVLEHGMFDLTIKYNNIKC
jgi:hypothetical protein